MSRLDTIFSFLAPKDLTRGVKFSTIVHLCILLFFIIAPIVTPHKYRGFRPTVHTVQLINIGGGQAGKQGTGNSQPSAVKPAVTQPVVTQPKIEAPVVKPKAEVRPVEQVKQTPKIVQKKPEMVIPDKKPLKKPVKEEKIPSLEERLAEKLKNAEEIKPTALEKKWEEPDTAYVPQESAVSGMLGTSGSLGLSAQTDFPFQWYLEALYNKICSSWTNPQMTLDKQYSAIISFTITKTGEINNINIKKSSGTASFDQSGMKAVELAKPFPQLPPGYLDSQLTVNVEFVLE